MKLNGRIRRARATGARTAALMLCSSLLAMPSKAWELHESEDEMTGQVSSYMVQEANEPLNLDALASNVTALLGFSCRPDGGSYYLRTHGTWQGLGFEVECLGGSCGSYQEMRMRFDEGETHTTKWTVWDSGYEDAQFEGASYTETAHTDRGPWWLTEQLRDGTRLLVEILFRGFGRHVMSFDIAGFDEVASECGEGKWAKAQREDHLAAKQMEAEWDTQERERALQWWKRSTAYAITEILTGISSSDAERIRNAAAPVLLRYKSGSDTALLMNEVIACTPCTDRPDLVPRLEALRDGDMDLACAGFGTEKHVPECQNLNR